MEANNRHPLESITNNNSLSMLEALIPFVEYPLKLPLALLIKFNEIRLIINAFRSLDNITRLGLHNISQDPMDMLCSLTGISPEMLKMLFSMMENMDGTLSPDMLSGLAGKSPAGFPNIANLFQSVSSSSDNGIHNTDFSPHTDNHMKQKVSDYQESEDFDRNIQNILAEYDLMQAEELNREHPEGTFHIPEDFPPDSAQDTTQTIY